MRRRVTRRAFLAGVGAVGGAALGSRTSGHARAAEPEVEQDQIPLAGDHRVIWSVTTDLPRAALTFDDGPDPEFTPHVLRILAERDVRATFLMMGHNALEHPQLARAIRDAGHEIGNHTATHRNLAHESSDVTRREIEEGAREIEAVTGVHTTLFRPPRGQLSAWSIRFAALTGHDTLMWSRTRGAEGDAVAVRSHLAQMVPGDVVLLHDGLGRGTFRPASEFTAELRRRRTAELEALPGVLADAHARQLELVTVSELLAGATPRPPAGSGGATE